MRTLTFVHAHRRCMRTFEDFLRRHPSTFLVHSKAIGALLRCSDCCALHDGGAWSPWKRESTRYSNQMLCLYADTAPLVDGNGMMVDGEWHMCSPQDMSARVLVHAVPPPHAATRVRPNAAGPLS